MTHDVWTLVRAERCALVDDLARLSPQEWARPSLAKGWTVHDVAAHLIDNARTTPFGLVRAMLRAKGNFDRQNANGIAAARGATPAQTLDRLREVTDRHQAGTKDGMGGARSMAEQVTVVADDTGLRLGDGPRLHGSALALLMALTGRRHALDELHGPGRALIPGA